MAHQEQSRDAVPHKDRELGTRDAQGGDRAPLGSPGAGLSDRNGPSDPDSKKQ